MSSPFPGMDPYLELFIDHIVPRPDQWVLVNRAWRREGSMAYQVFPILLTESLPGIPVPLRQGVDEVPLDLQFVVNRAYDSGPYRRGAVDYSRPPHPPLPEKLLDWLDQCLREAGGR